MLSQNNIRVHFYIFDLSLLYTLKIHYSCLKQMINSIKANFYLELTIRGNFLIK